jgi:hypothetical protein
MPCMLLYGLPGMGKTKILRRHVSANLSVDGTLQKVVRERELDGADGFTFEEFSVGSDTEGF